MMHCCTDIKNPKKSPYLSTSSLGFLETVPDVTTPAVQEMTTEILTTEEPTTGQSSDKCNTTPSCLLSFYAIFTRMDIKN